MRKFVDIITYVIGIGLPIIFMIFNRDLDQYIEEPFFRILIGYVLPIAIIVSNLGHLYITHIKKK